MDWKLGPQSLKSPGTLEIVGRQCLDASRRKRATTENFLESSVALSITGCGEAREVEAQKHPGEFLTPGSLGKRGVLRAEDGSRTRGGGRGAGEHVLCRVLSPGVKGGRVTPRKRRHGGERKGSCRLRCDSRQGIVK